MARLEAAREDPGLLASLAGAFPYMALETCAVDGLCATACPGRVLVPRDAGCCGFAGDRGFMVPELTAAATRMEAAEVKGEVLDGHFSSSRTCEVGMTRATGACYRSFLYLLEACTRP